jgi:hypothetical protein
MLLKVVTSYFKDMNSTEDGTDEHISTVANCTVINQIWQHILK